MLTVRGSDPGFFLSGWQGQVPVAKDVRMGGKNQHTEGGNVSLRLVYLSAFLICKQPSSPRPKNYLKDITFLQN